MITSLLYIFVILSIFYVLHYTVFCIFSFIVIYYLTIVFIVAQKYIFYSFPYKSLLFPQKLIPHNPIVKKVHLTATFLALNNPTSINDGILVK